MRFLRKTVQVIPRRCSSETLQEQYAKYTPRPLSAADYVHFAKKGNPVESFKFIREELPTRWMHLLCEMRTLPLKPTPLMTQLYNDFEQTVNQVLPFTEYEITPDVMKSYNNTLQEVVQRHKYTVDEVAITILEYKEALNAKGKEVNWDKAEDRVHYFLDRFFTNLIASNLIIYQHLHYFSGSKSERFSRGVIQNTNVTSEIQDMATKAKLDCKRYYGKTADVKITNVFEEETPESISMTFIPDHLDRIVYELLKNSLRATVENNESMPPVEVLISKGKQNIIVKISDKGVGASLRQRKKWGAYLYSTTPQKSVSKEARIAPLAGYGYGIPLSIVYARYLGGEVDIQTIQGYGTDVYIYLPSKPDLLVEILPVFNQKIEKFYQEKDKKPTWVTGKGSDVQFNRIR